LRSLFGRGPSSPTTVVIVLVITLLLEGSVTYTMSAGRLAQSSLHLGIYPLQVGWTVARVIMILAVVALWLAGKDRQLGVAIAVAAGVLTVGLLFSTVGLINVLFAGPTGAGAVLMGDVILIAVTNVLVLDLVLDHRSAGDRRESAGGSALGFPLPPTGRRPAALRGLAAFLHGLPVPGFQHEPGLQPDGHPAADQARQAADDAAGRDLRHHHRLHCR